MGCYINPPGQTKESWLVEHGKSVSESVARDWSDYDDFLLVILLHNPGFTAACIVYCEREREDCFYPGDLRPKTYWVVEKTFLLPYLGKL